MKNKKLTKDSDQNSIRQKETMRQKLKQAIHNRIEAARAARAYRKSPEFLEKEIDRLNQQAELETAKAKIQLARAKSAKAKSIMMNESSKYLSGLSSGIGFGSSGSGVVGFGSGILSMRDNFSGFDNLFGFGNNSSKKTKLKIQRDGMSDLFGI